MILPQARPIARLASDSALAAPPEEARLLALANRERAAAGVPALTLDAGVSVVARAWAQVMASVGGISHNPNYGNQIVGWSQVAERQPRSASPALSFVFDALRAFDQSVHR